MRQIENMVMRQIQKWIAWMLGVVRPSRQVTNGASEAPAQHEVAKPAPSGRQETPERQPPKGGLTEKQRVALGIEQFMNEHYELRFNILKQSEEFRPRQNEVPFAQKGVPFGGNEARLPTGDDCQWRQLTDRELRRIAFEQMKKAGIAWSVDVELYARSTAVPDYNPIADYLGRLAPWDGKTDHIGQTARRMPTTFAHWPRLFRCWFLGMVAQWLQLSREYGNALVPLLIGDQGTRKSTFCRQLLPPELRDYYVDDIKLDSAEQVERMLGRMLLVNIDEYNAKTQREQAKIKRVLTERDVQTRRMRSDQYMLLPRMASFIATTTEREPLCDPTGSRRYLCCEVTGIIDTDTPFDYAQLYAQALHELRHGARYYLTKDEEALVERHNQQYRCLSSPEELLTTYYEPAECCKANFMRAVDILSELRRHVRPAEVPSIMALTQALKACRFQRGRMHGRPGWYVRRREQQ